MCYLDIAVEVDRLAVGKGDEGLLVGGVLPRWSPLLGPACFVLAALNGRVHAYYLYAVELLYKHLDLDTCWPRETHGRCSGRACR